MSPPRTSLQTFLKHARSALRRAIGSEDKVTLVIGNESADLDSMTSSMLFAYVRSMSPPPDAFSSIYVPVANIPASGVAIRPEFLRVFKLANIEPSSLITLDDLPELPVIRSKLPPERTRWILVDHNALQGELGKVYGGRVGGVIDHHDEENKVPQATGDEPRIVEKSGSCTSLVTEHCRAAWDAFSAQDDSKAADAREDKTAACAWDAEVAQLGLASILIDTNNLTSPDKTTEHDRQAVAYLEAKIASSQQYASSYDRAQLYESIDEAKKDLGGLALQNILRKDYKQWDEPPLKLGISSVVKPMRFLQQKAADEAGSSASPAQSFVDALEHFAKTRELDVHAVMTTSTSSEGQFQRELVLRAASESEKAVGAAKRFARDAGEELGLEPWQEDGAKVYDCEDAGSWRRAWWQRNVQHSRKRVAPLLRAAMGDA